MALENLHDFGASPFLDANDVLPYIADTLLDGRRQSEQGKEQEGPAVQTLDLRGYDRALELHVLPDYGGVRVGAITRYDLQELVDRLDCQDLDGSTTRNVLTPLAVIYRRTLARGHVAVNPTAGLELPAPAKRPRGIASPDVTAALLVGLPKEDKPVWATALYADLRCGLASSCASVAASA